MDNTSHLSGVGSDLKKTKGPECCGQYARWVENGHSLKYWFCDKCRNEVNLGSPAAGREIEIDLASTQHWTEEMLDALFNLGSGFDTDPLDNMPAGD